MGLLDDAIREHLHLKRAHGASEDEVRRLEQEALGSPRNAGEFASSEPAAVAAEPSSGEPEPPPPVPAPEPPPEPPAELAPQPADPPLTEAAPHPEPEPWLDEPDEVPAREGLEPPAAAAPGEEDVLEETPEFLQETPEHDRLWFEQKPPRGFEFDE